MDNKKRLEIVRALVRKERLSTEDFVKTFIGNKRKSVLYIHEEMIPVKREHDGRRINSRGCKKETGYKVMLIQKGAGWRPIATVDNEGIYYCGCDWKELFLDDDQQDMDKLDKRFVEELALKQAGN